MPTAPQLTHDTDALAGVSHFLALARAGRSPRASTGERMAARLRTVFLASLSADMQDIDSEARLGFCNLLLAATDPDTRPLILNLK